MAEIQSCTRAVEEDVALYGEGNFSNRCDAIDFVDFHIMERMEGLPQNEGLHMLKQRAGRIKKELEKKNAVLFEKLRENVRTGVCAWPCFKEMVACYTGYGIGDESPLDNTGYDNLDVFVNGLFGHQPIPEATKQPLPENGILPKNARKGNS